MVDVILVILVFRGEPAQNFRDIAVAKQVQARRRLYRGFDSEWTTDPLHAPDNLRKVHDALIERLLFSRNRARCYLFHHTAPAAILLALVNEATTRTNFLVLEFDPIKDPSHQALACNGNGNT